MMYPDLHLNSSSSPPPPPPPETYEPAPPSLPNSPPSHQMAPRPAPPPSHQMAPRPAPPPSHQPVPSYIPPSDRLYATIPPTLDKRCWNQLDDLYKGNLKLNDEGKIKLTPAQHRVYLGDTPTCCDEDQTVGVKLLDLAGSVSLALHYDDGLASAIAKKLLPRLQALAAPDMNRRDLEVYWGHKVTSYLGKNVTITQGRNTRSGKLTGLSIQDSRFGSNLPPGYYKFRISGSRDVEVFLDLVELARGHANICLNDDVEEKADGEDFEEIWHD
ncbi:hypothetical protein PSV09DRAFT_1024938 [Bipolaris maydis]|nr:hypothetical protein PSV09DRAFT_1024938 [Bipolaris maydis]